MNIKIGEKEALLKREARLIRKIEKQQNVNNLFLIYNTRTLINAIIFPRQS